MKCVIVEDESLIAQELLIKINKIAPHITIIAQLDSVAATLSWLQENKEPDCWLMDVQLSDGISFEIFQQYNFLSPVIFTTAYEDYAIQAFKANGIDYLLKPIDDYELKAALQKATTLTQRNAYDFNNLLTAIQSSTSNRNVYKERILVPFRNKYIPIETEQIGFIYKDAVLKLYTFNNDHYTISYETLEELENQLNPSIFFRANRQCIVNKKIIQYIEPIENQKSLIHLSLPFEHPIIVSREKSISIKRWIEGY